MPGCQDYLEVDQTEVCLVVNMGYCPVRVVRVAGLQVSLLCETVILISHPHCHQGEGGRAGELTRAVRITGQLETLNTDN